MAKLTLEYDIDNTDPVAALADLLDDIINGQADICFVHQVGDECTDVSIGDVIDAGLL